MTSGPGRASSGAAAGGYLYHRHALAVRVMHWINVLSLVILLMSGLQIFNAHPALYWGTSSYTGRPPLLRIGSTTSANGELRGTVRLGEFEFETTGVLGVYRDADGDAVRHAFPSWLTIPGAFWLSMARAWHFFFAWIFVINGLSYIIYAIISGHLARDLAPTSHELRRIGASILDHLRLRHPTGEDARRYNVLQKLAYLAVIFGLLPLIVLAGWAMSPWLDAVLPGWVDWLGGRQSARTIHFIVAWLLVAFVAIHVFEVIVSGLWNHLRSMVTGNYRITPDARKDQGR
jgi:thiosulfate reductase cytochrome b subunit